MKHQSRSISPCNIMQLSYFIDKYVVFAFFEELSTYLSTMLISLKHVIFKAFQKLSTGTSSGIISKSYPQPIVVDFPLNIKTGSRPVFYISLKKYVLNIEKKLAREVNHIPVFEKCQEIS